MNKSILIVDDDAALCRLVVDGLGREGFEVRSATSPEEALTAMTNVDFDAALVDINMPLMNGLELSRRLLDQRPNLPIVVITAFGSLETAIAAIRAGAYDFVTKPFEIEQLVVAADRACQTHRLREVVTASPPFTDILGESAEVHRLCHAIEAVAQTDSTVLVTGESGTGKELVARAVHERGPRKSGPFVAMNCTAMTISQAPALQARADSRYRRACRAGSGRQFQARAYGCHRRQTP